MCKKLLNESLNGIELYFDSIPSQETREAMKAAGYRWHKVKKCWYAKQTPATEAIAQNLSTEEATEAPNASKKENILAPLWERCQISEIPEHSKHQSTKEISEHTRKHIKERFPEIKFSCTIGKGGWSAHNEVNFYFKSAPYSKDSEYLEAIKKYVKAWLWSFNYDNSDSMTDYFDRGFYEEVSTWDYAETEPTETQKADMADFDSKAEKARQEEEARQAAEYEKYMKEQEEAKKGLRNPQTTAGIQRAEIMKDIKIVDIEETKKYIINANMICGHGKECEIAEVKEEGTRKYESALIKREIYFTSEENYNNFCNMLIHDWDFLAGFGGTGTFDKRAEAVEHLYQLNAEQRESIKWFLWDCVAVFVGSELRLVIDPEGYNYARYTNIINGPIKKELASDVEKEEEQTEKEYFYFPDSIQKQSEKIEAGNDYTLIYNDPWTLSTSMHHIKINSITKTTYAQYKDAILLNYTEKGKRKVIQQFFYESKKMLLFDGWIPPVPEEMQKRKINDNMYELLTAGGASGDFMKNCAKYYNNNGYKQIINTLQY